MFAAFQHAAYAYALQETSDLDLHVLTGNRLLGRCQRLHINLGFLANDGDAQSECDK